MRINSVNNNYQAAQHQQSFGAIRGKNFDYTLTKLMPVYCNDSDKLARLAAEQAALAKTGQDFNSKLERLVLINSKGEEVHPVIGLEECANWRGSCHGELWLNVQVGDKPKDFKLHKSYCDGNGNGNQFDLEYLFNWIEIAIKRTSEAMAGPMKNLQFVLGIKPPPKPLAEVVLPEFAALSGIPEEQAKLLLPKLIEQLKTPSGKPATEKELLEIAQGVGCLPPALTQKDIVDIAQEVELPPVDANIETLKKFLGAA